VRKKRRPERVGPASMQRDIIQSGSIASDTLRAPWGLRALMYARMSSMPRRARDA
jgi:hypothetical protein